MPDILILEDPYQGSSAPTFFYDLYTLQSYQATSQACITDLTPPTFAGIATLQVQSRGQIRATWLAGTDVSLPVRYEIYIKAGSSGGLFSSPNLLAITDKLQYDAFTMPDGSFLVNGQTYYVGVKAIDAVGNRDGNSAVLSVISTGVSVGADAYEVRGAFSVNGANEFQGTMWILKNGVLSSDVVLGAASYQVYDKAGAAVPGMSGSGIAADVNGQFKLTPVTSALNEALDHYVVKVTIYADTDFRSGYVPLVKEEPHYDIDGLFFVNGFNDFDGTFWVSANEQLRVASLGAGSYEVFDHTGALVSGMSQFGIMPNPNGIYEIDHVPSLLSDYFPSYSVRVKLLVDGVLRSEMFPVNGQLPNYEVKGVFSINALNQLQATIWVVRDGQRMTASLGVANFTVFDASGVAVSGLTQTGIAADGNGRFISTPLSAALLADLTHYTVKLGVVVQGIERVSYKGFTLLGN